MRPPESADEREVRELLAAAERPVAVPSFAGVRRRQGRTPRAMVALVASLVIVASAVVGAALRDFRDRGAVGVVPSASASLAAPAQSPSPTATASVSATQPTPGAPASERYGAIVDGRPPYVRSETETRPITRLSGDGFVGAVSPNGRRIAYWESGTSGSSRVLVVVDAVEAAQPRTLLTLPASEIASTSTFGGVVWSTDGTGLLIGVNSSDIVRQAPVDAPYVYATLREVDVATASVHEIAREEPAFPFYPIAWDRSRGVAAAIRWGPGGFATGYTMVHEDGSTQTAGLPLGGTLPRFVRASPEGGHVLMLEFQSSSSAIAVWSLMDPARPLTLRPDAGERVLSAMWRDASEIVVSVGASADANEGDRLELWSLDGQRRVVLRARHRLEAVRPDGTAAITTMGVVDLATGATATMPGDPGVVASVLLSQSSTLTPSDVNVVRTLIAFARAPNLDTFAAVPFEDRVALGLADQLEVERSLGELAKPDAWVLRRLPFRGYVGPFSALDLLARDVGTTAVVGPHPHCASPPVPAPAAVAILRRVSVQPTGIDSCLNWWTVDVFLTSDGRIAAITLDLWEP